MLSLFEPNESEIFIFPSLFISELKFNSFKNEIKLSLFILFISISFKLISTGTSKSISINCLAFIELLKFSSKLFFNFSCFIKLRFSESESRVLNSFNNFVAVFFPTPGMPGILSELSPVRDLKSTI